MNNLTTKHYYILAGWLVINLLQAIFTGLHSDESYYWMYSENLAWGYFDHPPMVALLIHAGHLLLPGEIGVRLILIILSTATLALLFNELKETGDYFFLAVFVLSFPLIHTHIAGFLAIPDIPLLFFTVVFLIVYKNFLKQEKLSDALFLGVVAAAMIYSKYHAFLVIGLFVLSNLSLLRKKYFWLAVAVTVLLLIPHFFWQINNDFPTFKYHLIERARPFQLRYVFPNLLNQLLMAGPLTGILIFWKLSKTRTKDKFQRGLIFNITGFYILFFLLSFKNRIEAHWSAAIIPMLIILTYPAIAGDPRVKQWFKRLAIPVILLMFVYRAYLAMDFIPNIGQSKITFYNRQKHAVEIKEMAEGKKVGFFNNYAAISNYIFYSGDSAVHLSTPGYRFNQYDLWNEENYAEGETIFAIQSEHLNPPHLTRMATGQMKGYIIIDEFQSLNGLHIQLLNHTEKNEHIHFEVRFTNTTNRTIKTEHLSEPCLGVMQDQTELYFVPLVYSSEKVEIEPGDTATLSFSVAVNLVDKKLPLVFYTRSKNEIRGEVLTVRNI